MVKLVCWSKPEGKTCEKGVLDPVLKECLIFKKYLCEYHKEKYRCNCGESQNKISKYAKTEKQFVKFKPYWQENEDEDEW